MGSSADVVCLLGLGIGWSITRDGRHAPSDGSSAAGTSKLDLEGPERLTSHQTEYEDGVVLVAPTLRGPQKAKGFGREQKGELPRCAYINLQGTQPKFKANFRSETGYKVGVS